MPYSMAPGSARQDVGREAGVAAVYSLLQGQSWAPH